MPTYEYECEKCGGKFDLFQKMSDKPVSVCPQCGGAAIRLISAGSGIIFKGSGFYETDYKTKKGSKSDEPPSCPKASDKCKGCPAGVKKK